jgi:integrase
MLANGTNAKVVSERLGHSSITLTMDTYSAVLPTLQEEATTRLASLVLGARKREVREQ